MTLEELTQRLTLLKAQHKHFETQFMVLNGHIGEVEFQISQYNKVEDPVVQDEPCDSEVEQAA